MNKCTVVFVVGLFVATASIAFFGEWMQKGMSMPAQMMNFNQPQPQQCDCSCNK